MGFSLKSKTTQVDICSTGASIQRLFLVDAHGHLDDVVLGFDHEDDYRTKNAPYFGCIVGRVANRIAGGTFTLEDGRTCTLPQNNGPNCLHGGIEGFNVKQWKLVDQGEDDDGQFCVLQLFSPDHDNGFPGAVTATVRYSLSYDGSKLRVEMKATIEGSETPINMAQHSYFNFGGHACGSSILDHDLILEADHYTPVDAVQIPTGEIRPVEKDSVMDFRESRPIGSRINDIEGGYDHNYVLRKDPNENATLSLAATVVHATSGRGMRLYTTAPGVQLYTGNFLDGSLEGKSEVRYQKHGGLCLETQGFPDSVHHKHFPTIILRPGEEYCHIMEYEFFTFSN